MREIKFRGRNPLTKQWEYGFLITVDLSSEKLSKNLTAIIKENAWYEPSEGIGGFKLVEPQTVGQYTGLNDKNGKQIYEGDIVNWCIDGREKPTRIAQVMFKPDIIFNSNVGIFNYGDFAYQDTYNHLTVIGNIHDNPELFEVSNA